MSAALAAMGQPVAAVLVAAVGVAWVVPEVLLVRAQQGRLTVVARLGVEVAARLMLQALALDKMVTLTVVLAELVVTALEQVRAAEEAALAMALEPVVRHLVRVVLQVRLVQLVQEVRYLFLLVVL
jgi:hypothetical protein